MMISARHLLAFAAVIAAGVPVASAADAALAGQRKGDQAEAFEARKAGRVLPLRDIERRVVPQMRGSQYLGPNFDSLSGIYTLKFLRDGNVIWVEVDGATGQILGRSGW